jgi:hypothetical protein
MGVSIVISPAASAGVASAARITALTNNLIGNIPFIYGGIPCPGAVLAQPFSVSVALHGIIA